MTRIMNEAFIDPLEDTRNSFPTSTTEMMDEIRVDYNTTTIPFHDLTEYIFDRTDVRAIFLTLYTIVFCSCFFGNLMVILVVCLHWRMRSITNFCLANLAFADLCVGIFCVYQNIISYMMESWIFGEFMCKMYHFISSLSTTASILILVVICIERYLAIIHPMRCKQMLTLYRLRLTIVGVWIISALISSPRFYYFRTMSMPYSDGKVEVMCVPNRLIYDSKLVDLVSMTLLFLLPLMVISILYFRIGVSLWKSSSANMQSASTSAESSSSSGRCDSNAGLNTNHHLHSTASSPASGERKRSIFHALRTCLPRLKTRRRHRRSSGSFYGGADRSGYAPVNLTTINGLGGVENCPPNQATTSITITTPRNVNGLVISCNGSSLTPIIKSGSTSQTTNSAIMHHHHHNTSNVQCCNCTSKTDHRKESVPVSPYLKRDSTPISSPLATSTSIHTEPIVLVKFEKKSSMRKCKRSKCTILMSHPMSCTTLSDEGCGGGGNCNFHGNPSSIAITRESEEFANCEPSPYGGAGPTVTNTGCQICEKMEPIIIDNERGSQHELLNKVDGCDKNLDTHSVKGPHHSHTHFSHQCGTHCQGSQCSTVKRPNSSITLLPPMTTTTTKGPKRMRVVRSSKYGTRALQCRRRIIKMLIVIVVAFAMCHLPFHARKIWQYWGKGYEAGSVFSSLFTPITFLIMYIQSMINPVLYAFFSRKFRQSFADLLCCNMRRSLKISRNLSVRSTNVAQLSQAA